MSSLHCQVSPRSGIFADLNCCFRVNICRDITTCYATEVRCDILFLAFRQMCTSSRFEPERNGIVYGIT